jgi:hypothetical protein
VERIAEANPEKVISFFVGGLRNRTTRDMLAASMREQRYCPIYFRDIHHCVALLWPWQKAQAFLHWAQTTKVPGIPREPRSDDAFVGAWARLTRNPVLATVPNLVEHQDVQLSTIGKRAAAGRDRGRVSILFIGEEDPLALDWT